MGGSCESRAKRLVAGGGFLAVRLIRFFFIIVEVEVARGWEVTLSVQDRQSCLEALDRPSCNLCTMARHCLRDSLRLGRL